MIHNQHQKKGIFYALLCYCAWGFVPLYWKALHSVPTFEILSHRIIWSMFFFVALILKRKRLHQLFQSCKNPKYFLTYLITASLIGTNWLVYIYAVNTNQVLESSLGYFINPLVSVLLGLFFLGETLRPMQWVSLACASVGVLFLTAQADHFPFIAILLALTFGLYGLVRKKSPLEPLLASSLESIMLTPLAAIFLGFLFFKGEGALGHSSLKIQALLILGGAITATPLLWFAEAAARLPLSTLGFLQYISPTIQFLLAVFLYHEDFSMAHAISFSFIWIGLIIFVADSLMKYRKNKGALKTPIK